MRKRWRRVYREGQCEDCGWTKPVTLIMFWLTGPSFKMRVCKDCIKPYRRRILTHHMPDGSPGPPQEWS